MTGRIDYTPEAEQQLHDLDEWIIKAASAADTAQRFVNSIMGHIEGILVFPHAGRAHDDIRPGTVPTAWSAPKPRKRARSGAS